MSYIVCVFQVVYKNTNKLPVYSDSSLLARTDISHAQEASKLASKVDRTENTLPSMHWAHSGHCPQVKYQELKGQRPRYNPLDCLSFRHTQAAAALASQVRVQPCPLLSCPVLIFV